MMLHLSAALAEGHRRDLVEEAAAAHLRSLVRCTHPTALRRSAGRLLAWLRAAQLGPGYVPPLRAAVQTRCC
jgi:hypothetical protein